MKLRLSLSLCSFLLIGCVQGAGTLEIQDAWVRPADAGMNTAVYFLVNNHAENDRLLRADSAIAEKTEIHRSYLDDTGMMRMEQQDSVIIPADHSVYFEPGGLHVMLINLSRDLRHDEQIQLRLHFENKGEIIIDVPAETR